MLSRDLALRRDTPTCVGISTRTRTPTLATTGHPHVRGDQPFPAFSTKPESGTPPRAWGSGKLQVQLRGRGRDTPTCVGISSQVLTHRHSIAGHPHVRGDQSRRCCRSSAAAGTPPRAWGSGRGAEGVALATRDTPTCVGIRRSTRSLWTAGAGHPHVRGDQSSAAPPPPPAPGTPPRAWGSGPFP